MNVADDGKQPERQRTELHARLGPVRSRLHRQAMLRVLGGALRLGSFLAICIALLKMVLPPLPVMFAAAVPLLAGLLVGLWLGSRRRPTWQAAAAAVDRHGRLEDRTATALHFLTRGRRRQMEQLQIDDALSHLGTVDAAAVVPTRVPRNTLAGAILLLIAVGLILWPLPRAGTPAAQPPRGGLVEKPPSEKAEPRGGSRPKPERPSAFGFEPAPRAAVPNIAVPGAIHSRLSDLARCVAQPESPQALAGRSSWLQPAGDASAPLREQLLIRRYFERVQELRPRNVPADQSR